MQRSTGRIKVQIFQDSTFSLQNSCTTAYDTSPITEQTVQVRGPDSLFSQYLLHGKNAFGGKCECTVALHSESGRRDTL